MLTIWCNADLTDAAQNALVQSVQPHRLLLSKATANNLTGGTADSLMAQADIAFGQPDPEQVIALPRLRWVHLTSAGYTRYDRADLRVALAQRRGILTNSSSVYDEPCAQHVLAMMLACSQQLPVSFANQATVRFWPAAPLRQRSFLLRGQTALILGFGAIARRLVQLLHPFQMNLLAVRRKPRGDEPIDVRDISQLDALLPLADHVIDVLPASVSTDRLVDARRLALMKRSAFFYNIGRGNTVDQPALLAALQSGQIAGAYLDVTDPEPLPPDHPLWTVPNCHITPHTAGGHVDEFDRLVAHFLENLHRWPSGAKLLDQVF